MFHPATLSLHQRALITCHPACLSAYLSVCLPVLSPFRVKFPPDQLLLIYRAPHQVWMHPVVKADDKQRLRRVKLFPLLPGVSVSPSLCQL